MLAASDLEHATLRGANLQGAYLQDANLKDASLRGARVSRDQLATAKSLKGATMPDGTKHD